MDKSKAIFFSVMALSKTQTKRLGGLLSVMFKEDSMPSEILNSLVKEGLVELVNGGAILTDTGNDERRRLLTLAGMNIAYKAKEMKPTQQNRTGKLVVITKQLYNFYICRTFFQRFFLLLLRHIPFRYNIFFRNNFPNTNNESCFQKNPKNHNQT